MKQRYAKRDANHGEIVKWYRDLGCYVAETQDAGLGVPDLFVGCAGITDPVEVKTEVGDLEESQKVFIAAWRGSRVWIVRTFDEVTAHVQNMRRRARYAA